MFDDIDLRFILADTTGELHEKIETSKSLSMINNALQSHNHFLDLIRALTSKSAEDFFLSLQVMRRDFTSSIQHIESMKILLDWTVRVQSSNMVEVQLEVIDEVVNSITKADIIKVLFFDSKAKTFSTVASNNKIESGDLSARSFHANKDLISELKALQTTINIYSNPDDDFFKGVESCIDTKITSFAVVPMIDSSSQEFKGRRI